MSEYRPQRRQVRPEDEHRRTNFLQDGFMSQENVIIDSNKPNLHATKFSRGFARRMCPKAHGVSVPDILQHSSYTSGYDLAHLRTHNSQYTRLLTDEPVAPSADYVSTKGRRHLHDHRSEFGSREQAIRMRTSSYRFFSSSQRKTQLNQGRSDVLNICKNEQPSYSAANNFQYSVNDSVSQTLSQSSHPAPHTCVRPTTDMPLSGMMKATERAQSVLKNTHMPRARDPDRIFDCTSPAQLHPAVVDREKQHVRLLREIQRSMPSRPHNRPKSLLARAGYLDMERRRRAKHEDIVSVQNLG